MFSGAGAGIISDTGKSPMLSSKNDLRNVGGDDGDSFAVSMLQTTFEQEPSQNDLLLLRQRKFDTLSTDQAATTSLDDCKNSSSILALNSGCGGYNINNNVFNNDGKNNNNNNNIQSASISMTRG